MTSKAALVPICWRLFIALKCLEGTSCANRPLSSKLHIVEGLALLVFVDVDVDSSLPTFIPLPKAITPGE